MQFPRPAPLSLIGEGEKPELATASLAQYSLPKKPMPRPAMPSASLSYNTGTDSIPFTQQPNLIKHIIESCFNRMEYYRD